MNINNNYNHYKKKYFNGGLILHYQGLKLSLSH